MLVDQVVSFSFKISAPTTAVCSTVKNTWEQFIGGKSVLGPVRPHISGYFLKNTPLHVEYSNRFRPSSDANAKTMEIRYSIAHRESVMLVVYMMYDIIVFKNLRSRPCTHRREASVLKSLHFGLRF